MPRFNVSVSFSLRTELEPEGIGFDAYGVDGVEDINDDSTWYGSELESDGGSVTFTIECEDEDAARDAADQIVNDGNVVDDANGIGWEISDVTVEVEEVEIPMDLATSRRLIEEFLSSFERLDDDLEAAFRFLLDLIGTVPTLAERDAEIRRLQGHVTRLENELTLVAPQPQAVPAVSDPETGIITEPTA